MRFQPSFDNDAAGIMLFKDEKHQLLLVRTLNAGKQTIELQQVSKDGKKVLASQPCKLNEVEMKITSTGTTFEFFYKAKKDWVKIGDAPAQQLSTQAAGGFTGTVVALYCTGKEAKK
jgi:alpha-N-arabinofuranosidase